MKDQRGIAIFAFFRGQILLILRDDKPDISCPNLWCVPTGGLEEGEDYKECAVRECLEELGISPELTFYGVSPKGNGIFVVELTEEERNSIRLGEGQEFGFFNYREVEALFSKEKLGGITKVYFEGGHRVIRMNLLKTVLL